jgi:hypothetical protein
MRGEADLLSPSAECTSNPSGSSMWKLVLVSPRSHHGASVLLPLVLCSCPSLQLCMQCDRPLASLKAVSTNKNVAKRQPALFTVVFGNFYPEKVRVEIARLRMLPS